MKKPQRLTGWAALAFAGDFPEVGELCKYNDPLEPAARGLTLKEARAICQEDPSLIYLDLEAKKSEP